MKAENRFLYLIALSVAVTLYDIFVIAVMPVLHDQTQLLRYMLEKSVNGFTSTIALLWVLQMAEWITPNEWMEKISENPIACALVYGVLAYCVSQVWIYG